jgi:hypothetical protein
MKNQSSKPKTNNSLENSQPYFKKETYFSLIEENEENEKDDCLDDNDDDFYCYLDIEPIDDSFESFEIDNFD